MKKSIKKAREKRHQERLDEASRRLYHTLVCQSDGVPRSYPCKKCEQRPPR